MPERPGLPSTDGCVPSGRTAPRRSDNKHPVAPAVRSENVLAPSARRDAGVGRSYGREPRHISYGEAAAASVARQLDPLGDRRHRQLYLAALTLGSLVAGDELPVWRAECILKGAGCRVLGLSMSDVQKQVDAGLKKGMQSPRSAPEWRDIQSRTDAIMRWVSWLEDLDHADPVFAGRKGTSLLRFHVGIGIAGMTVGKIDLGLSVRRCAEFSGLSTSTVCTLLKGNTVEKAGYLHVERQTGAHPFVDGYSPLVWTPTRKRGLSRHLDVGPTSTHPGVATTRVSRSPAANVFHRRAAAFSIAQLLADDEEATVGALGKATGFTPSAVRDNLKYLAANGLAMRVDRFHWRGTLTGIDPLEPAPDGVDHAARRRVRHEEERRRFTEKRAEWTAARLEARANEKRDGAADEGGYVPGEPEPIFDPDTGEIVCDIVGTISIWPDSIETPPNRFKELDRLASFSKEKP